MRLSDRHSLRSKFNVDYTGEAIVYMASLPLEVNVLNQVRLARSKDATVV
jgi:hypothetical protein